MENQEEMTDYARCSNQNARAESPDFPEFIDCDGSICWRGNTSVADSDDKPHPVCVSVFDDRS